jgi:hypothetical protein
MGFAKGYRDQIAESEVRLLIVFMSIVTQCDYGDAGRCIFVSKEFVNGIYSVFRLSGKRNE